jgi:hypothetical protein
VRRSSGIIADVRSALLLLLAGCELSQTLGGGNDPTGLCPFPEIVHEYVDPCEMAPSLDTLPDVTITDAATLDTAVGAIIGTGVPAVPSAEVNGVRVVWTRSFTIAGGGSLRARGPLPLAIIATTTIAIDGRLDAASTKATRGPGSNPAACAQLAAAPGEQCNQHGGSGGGGGGFGTMGAAGGEGGNTRDCNGDGKPGGAGGTAIVGPPPEFRAGCDGAIGSKSDNTGSTDGVAGFGGGAVALIAREKIVVGPTGVLHVGGGGGQPGAIRAGGGGGGSGGMIFLEAIEVDLQPSSVLAANGGGGASGVDMDSGEEGDNGKASIEEAEGGETDSNGGDGGDGSALMKAATLGSLGERGGGGGGGGVGVIRVHQLTGTRRGVTSPLMTD